MKKYIGIFVLLLMFFVLTPTAKAYTLDDLMAQITSLQQQVSDIQSQLSATALKAVTPTPISVACSPTTTPWVKVTSPNGGETFTAGNPVTVTWTSCNLSTSSFNTDIYIKNSINGPLVAYLNVGGFLQNGGSKTFILPTNLATGNYLVFVGILGANNYLAATDYSDNLFTINAKTTACDPTGIAQPWVKVLSPNGGEAYNSGQEINIAWNSCNQGSTGNWGIAIESATAPYYNTYITPSNLSFSSQSFLWMVPTNFTGGQYKARVFCGKVGSEAYCTGSALTSEDRSDNSFTINVPTSNNNLPAGCTSATGYSYTTGLSCGCNGTVYSTYNGQLCPVTTTALEAVTAVTPITTTIPTTITDIKAVQSALVSQGYLVGKVDGIIGPATTNAVKSYQTAKGLSPTGIVDSATSALLKPTFVANLQIPTLGATGSRVIEIQGKLIERDCLKLPLGVSPGYWGPLSIAALTKCKTQEEVDNNNLKATWCQTSCATVTAGIHSCDGCTWYNSWVECPGDCVEHGK